MTAEFRQGRAAFQLGIKSTDCPLADPKARSEWMSGWLEGANSAAGGEKRSKLPIFIHSFLTILAIVISVWALEENQNANKIGHEANVLSNQANLINGQIEKLQTISNEFQSASVKLQVDALAQEKAFKAREEAFNSKLQKIDHQFQEKLADYQGKLQKQIAKNARQFEREKIDLEAKNTLHIESMNTLNRLIERLSLPIQRDEWPVIEHWANRIAPQLKSKQARKTLMFALADRISYDHLSPKRLHGNESCKQGMFKLQNIAISDLGYFDGKGDILKVMCLPK